MLRVKEYFMEGDAIQGAASYQLSEHLGENITEKRFINPGYINTDGKVYGEELRTVYHTDFIEISRLRDYEGYCVGTFNADFIYPTVLFFDYSHQIRRYYFADQISNKGKLTADEIKYLMKGEDSIEYVAFNGDSIRDYVYISEGVNYSPIDTKPIIQEFQGFNNVGTIIGSSTLIPSASRTNMYLGQDYNIQPITEHRVDGKRYLFKVYIPLKVETNEGIITQSVDGYLYVDSPTLSKPLKATGFSYKDMNEPGSVKSYRALVLETNYGDITLAKIDNKYLYGSVSINSDDGHFSIYHAKEEYKHTDFIPLDALTDGLKVNVDGVEKSYCVGKLYNNNGELESGFNPIAFFPDVGSTYVGYYPLGFPDKYLTADEVRAMAGELSNDVLGEAKYVMFSAIDNGTNENEKALVSVGGIWFTLSKYEKLKDNKKHNLAVRALVANGDELFSDSDYSDDVEYFYTYPSCQLQISNEWNGYDVNVIYQVYEKGNNVTKTIDMQFDSTMFDNMVTGSEIIINNNIQDPKIILEDKSQFTAEHRYDGNKTYITVPNYKKCTLVI